MLQLLWAFANFCYNGLILGSQMSGPCIYSTGFHIIFNFTIYRFFCVCVCVCWVRAVGLGWCGLIFEFGLRFLMRMGLIFFVSFL